jgi:hypothetical protein
MIGVQALIALPGAAIAQTLGAYHVGVIGLTGSRPASM